MIQEQGDTGSNLGNSDGSSDIDDRLIFIQNVSHELSRAHSVQEVAEVMVTQCRSALGANAGSIALLDQARIGLATIYHSGYPATIAAELSAYPVTAKYPTADVARTGEVIFIETLADRNMLYPHLAKNSSQMERGAITAIPLVVSDAVIGSLVLNFPKDRQFPGCDRAYIQTVAQVCAQALARQIEMDERRSAEEAVSDAEARMGAILEAALDCVITIDDQGLVVDWNPASERTFGFSRSEAVGNVLAELIIPPLMRAAHWEGMRRYLETGDGPILNRRLELVAHNSKGDEVPIEAAIVPLRLKDRNLFTAYARDISERHVIADKQWIFIRDMLLAVTDSKLRLCQSDDDLPSPLIPVGEEIILTRETGVAGLRHLVGDLASDLGFTDERAFDIQTAVSEAGMNAIIHGGGGRGAVRIKEDSGTLQVKITDQGKGISLDQLPAAALTRGYSTSATLGHGLKMMVETTDRVFLVTNPAGTTTVLEMDRAKPMPPWLSL